MFRIIEETQSTDLYRKSSSEFFTQFIDGLKDALSKGILIHYWINEVNLLEDIDAQSMQALLYKVQEVRGSPQRYVADNWLEIIRCARLNCCACRENRVAVGTVITVQPSDSTPCCGYFNASYTKDTTCCRGWPYNPVYYDVY